MKKGFTKFELLVVIVLTMILVVNVYELATAYWYRSNKPIDPMTAIYKSAAFGWLVDDYASLKTAENPVEKEYTQQEMNGLSNYLIGTPIPK